MVSTGVRPARRSVVAVERVSKAYGATQALRDVSLEVHQGTILTLLGQNGSGKSTLVRMITGAERPDAGFVRLNGLDVTGSSSRARYAAGVRALYQEGSLIDTLSVGENVCLYARRLLGRRLYSPSWAARTAHEALSRVGLSGIEDEAVGALDTRTRQLVEIARCLVGDPHLIVLDEPTSALDAEDSARLTAIVKDLRSSGVSFLYITHILAEALSVADEIAVIRQGSLVGSANSEQWTPDSLTEAILGGDEPEGRPVGAPRSTHSQKATGAIDGTLLEVEGLTAGNLRDIRLDVREGEVVGITGLAGSGIHLLGRLLANREHSWHRTSGPNPVRTSGRRGSSVVGYVPPSRGEEGLNPAGSIRDNLFMGARGRGRTFGVLNTRRELAGVGRVLTEYEVRGATGPDAPIVSLSGGNQQKVMVARAYVGRPAVVVLDQPTRGVDIGSRAELHSIIKGAARRGTGTVVISEDPDELATVADRVYVLRRGQILAELHRPTQEEIYEAIIG